MQLLSKSELADKLGKPSFWMPKRTAGVGEYLAGLPELDEKIGESNFLKVMPLVNFEVYPEGLGIVMLYKFKNFYCGIVADNITSIAIERGELIEMQEKSVVGRAVVGGLLLGPLGAVIGGASGLKNKAIKENDKLLIQSKSDEGDEEAFLMQIKKGKTNELYQFFKANFSTDISFHQ